jgi:chromosome segregation ATPase
MPTDQEIEDAAATIFCHAQFKGDDYTARQLAKKIIAAALEARDAEITSQEKRLRGAVLENAKLHETIGAYANRQGALMAEIAELRSQRDMACANVTELAESCKIAMAEIAKLTAGATSSKNIINELSRRLRDAEPEVEKLRAVLEPFAAWIKKVDARVHPDHTDADNGTLLVNGLAVVTYGDLRRAAAALEQRVTTGKE